MTNREFYNSIKILCAEYKRKGIDINFNDLKPFSEKDIYNCLNDNEIAIPYNLIEFFSMYSGGIEISGELLPDMIVNVNSVTLKYINFRFSFKEVILAENSRREWVKNVYSDVNNDYDKVWHDKTGIMRIGDSDILAVNANNEVIYLSHDGGSGHGTILGKSIEDFYDNLINLRLLDLEYICVKPICHDNSNYIDVKSNSYKMVRDMINI